MRRLGVALFFCLVCGFLAAQDHSQAAPPAKQQSAQTDSQQTPANPNAAIGEDLSKASEQAVHSEEGHEENAEFKYSAMVARLGRMIGIGTHGMYWVSMTLNFLFLAFFFWMLLKAKVPQIFRERTNTIQKALQEARAAGAEASRRLGDIEARLSKLDAEVSGIRGLAEQEAIAEEQRIRASAEEDKRKVVEAAESEIAAIARNARHDLKNFAASLAVDIAAHKIKVDDNTDQVLVRRFVGHLGKDGE
jgi:F-type H+-transporting ATPase subunit b